jgi:CspA family cold shock protein
MATTQIDDSPHDHNNQCDSPTTTPSPPYVTMPDTHPVFIEVADQTFGGKIGMCKWFNNVHGYGFLTIIDGDDHGMDVFVHHSGIIPANSLFKSLRKGEYVSFDVVEGAQGSQATNVRGIKGGPLLCDHIPVRKNTPHHHTNNNNNNNNNANANANAANMKEKNNNNTIGANGWSTVNTPNSNRSKRSGHPPLPHPPPPPRANVVAQSPPLPLP